VLIELEGPRDAGQLVQSLAGLEGVVEVGLAEGYEAD
jgi:hypothetical protein